MTVAAASAAYELARVALERAAADLRAAIEIEVAERLHGLPAAFRAVLDAVAAEWAVSPGDLLGRRRTVDLALPRHVLFALAAERADLSAHALGALLGREKSGVTWSIRAFADLCRTDERFAHRVSRVRAALGASPTP